LAAGLLADLAREALAARFAFFAASLTLVLVRSGAAL
jgi:hypothetical protein